MKRGIFTLAFVAMLPAIAVAQSAAPLVETDVSAARSDTASHPAPYAKLAQDLATPDLVSSQGPQDKSLLKLRFVGSGESDANWAKMTSISIAKVKPEDTQTATRSIITKFKTSLEAQKHAKVSTFDTTLLPKPNAFFEFVTSDGTAEQGVAYSPTDGFVSIIQIAYKHGYVHAAKDREMLKAVIAGR